jgi:hypothetical protein
MTDKVGEIEGIKISGISIRDLLSKEVMNKIDELKLNISPINLVFVREEGSDNKKSITPFVLGHQNSQEVKDKILHISGSNEDDLQKLAKIIKGD